MNMTTVQVTIPLAIWKEHDLWVAFTPALELSSCGTSETDAIEKFSEAVDLFFETAVDRNVVENLLESLGWERLDNSWLPSAEPAGNTRAFNIDVPVVAHAA